MIRTPLAVCPLSDAARLDIILVHMATKYRFRSELRSRLKNAEAFCHFGRVETQSANSIIGSLSLFPAAAP